MKAPELYRQLRLFERLVNPKAIAAEYRAMALAPGHVRAAGLSGQMQVELGLGLANEVLLDGDDFIKTLKSLPAAEFTITVKDNALRWRCGSVRGHLSLLTDRVVIAQPQFPMLDDVITAEFGTGLDLGALACGSPNEMRAHNLFGVQIASRGRDTVAYSTDNKSFSGCDLAASLQCTGTVTLLPAATSLLSTLIKRDKEALFGFDDRSVYCITASTKLLLHQVPPLRAELMQTARLYAEAQTVVPLSQAVVASFLRRAEALSEEKAIVTITLAEGRMGLAFHHSTASSEEFYVVNDGPEISLPPITIEAHRLAVVLKHADRLVLDYAKQNFLVLRGPQGFLFVIAGRPEASGAQGRDG